MKKYFILFILPLVIFGCDDFITNEFTFYIDGVYYDLSDIDPTNKFSGGTICSNDMGLEGGRYDEKSPLDYFFYYFMGYNPDNCEDCSYGGQFLDTTIQQQTVFNIPDTFSATVKVPVDVEYYFWINVEREKRVYDAISGYIEMINDTKRFFDGTVNRHHNAHGTFDFIMVNRFDESDTVHVTNGKFKYHRYSYSESYRVNDPKKSIRGN